MHSFKTVLLLFMLIIEIDFIKSDNPCFDCTKENVQKHLGSKSSYRFVQNYNDSVIKFNNCEAVKIWSVIRHGTRNPGSKTIQKFKKKLFTIRDKILQNQNNTFCKKDLENFRLWNFEISETEESYLTHIGQNEMIELAERMQNRFPDLLSDLYDNSTYKFRFTATERTLKSFQAFATGLFGRHNIKQIWYPKPLSKDPILRFYKLCDRWLHEVKNNRNSVEEHQKFLMGKEMNEIKHFIIQQTGIQDLGLYDIQLMYTACGFELSSDKYKISPWCSLFNSNSIKVLEFLEDLKYYWLDGYGYDITARQACPVISDIFEHFQSDGPNASFYFTHSGALLKILTFFGLYRDEFPLTHADFEKLRKWRVSQIGPFGSNLTFVLFDCKKGPHILVLHQERIVHLPGCPKTSHLCPLDVFKFVFNDFIENCLFDDLCEIKKE